MSKTGHNCCAIPSCGRNEQEVSSVSFHRFPANLQQREIWTLRIRTAGLELFAPKTTDRICSRHFETCYVYDKFGSKRLKKDALPSLYLEPATIISISAESRSDIPGPSTPKRARHESSDCSKRLFSIGVSPISTTPSSKPSSKRLLTPSSFRLKYEHSYATSPTSTATELLKVRNQLSLARKEIVSLKKKLKRREEKLCTVSEKLSMLKTITSEQKTHLQNQFSGILGELVSNQKALNSAGEKKGVPYSEEIKKFSVTLHFYSPRAYSFMRKYLSLPHPNTLSAWMDSTGCGPGMNIRIISRIAEARKNAKNPFDLVDVALIIDEMAIHKDLIWDPKNHKYVGHVDYGTGDNEGDAPLAGNALVLMIATMCGGIKIPIGFVFTEKADSAHLQSFLLKGFVLLEEYGFNVLSLTSDGNSSNVATFKQYGVVEDAINPFDADGPIRFGDIINEFVNPANNDKQVCAIYDAVHMIKLWRSTLAECKDVKWRGKHVDFSCVRLLHDLQNNENILAANKLTNNHLHYGNHKMRVSLAVQLLSKSVADAIGFCREDVKIPQFANSKPTEDFFRLLDRFFDICNSRHPSQPGTKAPLRRENLEQAIQFLQSFCSDVLAMTCTETRKVKGVQVDRTKFLTRSLRKRAAIGSVITSKSIISIGSSLLYRQVNPLKFVLTYRLCQDHLEIFFGKVRNRLGNNNNPNVLEFSRIMVHIWHHNLLKSTNTGNCIEFQEEGAIPEGLLPLGRHKKIMDDTEIEELDLEGLESPLRSMFYKNCLAYMAGFVVRRLSSQIKCITCVNALFNNPIDLIAPGVALLIRRKQFKIFPDQQSSTCMKGLIYPCNSVFKVVEKADEIFRHLVTQNNGSPTIKKMDIRICIAVTKFCLEQNLFPHLTTHVVDFDPTDPESESHLTLLIKKIVNCFLKIRLFSHGKRFMKSKFISTRHQSTKLVLFKNQ